MRTRQRILVATLAALAGCALAAQTAGAVSNPGAAQAVSDALMGRIPSITDLFVNCPTENTVPTTDGSVAQNCEFRAVASGAVSSGEAVAKQVGAQWQVSDLILLPPAPDSWVKCRKGGGGSANGQKPRAFRAHGVVCSDLKLLISDIRALPLERNLRLPKRFTVAGHGTNTIGFITIVFQCRGITRVLQQGENTFGLLTASCFNPFGDGFTFRFTQSS